jgi:hypothetical protein
MSTFRCARGHNDAQTKAASGLCYKVNMRASRAVGFEEDHRHAGSLPHQKQTRRRNQGITKTFVPSSSTLQSEHRPDYSARSNGRDFVFSVAALFIAETFMTNRISVEAKYTPTSLVRERSRGMLKHWDRAAQI